MDTRQIGQEHTRPFSPEEQTPSGIPLSLTPSFQEYDIERLDPTLRQDLIVERVLTFGDRREEVFFVTPSTRGRIPEPIRDQTQPCHTVEIA